MNVPNNLDTLKFSAVLITEKIEGIHDSASNSDQNPKPFVLQKALKTSDTMMLI